MRSNAVSDRSGLGKEEEEKRNLEEAMQMRAKLEVQSVDSFKAQQAAKYKERYCAICGFAFMCLPPADTY